MTYSQISFDRLISLDIETLKNCFTLVAKDYKTGSEKEFVIYVHKKYNGQAFELFKFLRSCVRNKFCFITFNGLAFDMQILHFFYEWCCDQQDPLYELDTKFIIDNLYAKAQEIISQQDDEERFKNQIPEGQLFLPTIDLFKQNHFDRKQKSTGLKWLEFSMRFPNIEEMPIEHSDLITIDQIDEIISYNRNDVLATHEFFKLTKHETELRLKLSEKYKRNLVNASEPRMAREIFGTVLAPQMGIQYSELKKLRTIRKLVAFKDIIFPYVKFVTPQLQKVLEDLKAIVIDCNPHSKQKFEYNFDYNGLKVYLGLGGIHACNNPGVYVPTEDKVIRDSDVVSFYPNLAIRNNLKPLHLGDAFTTVYNEMYEQRKLIPKSDPENYIIKIILNSAYGLSSEINSYFYDKQFTYGITINGQLSLLMLCEALYLSVPGVKMIQKNTDGISYIYPKKYQSIVEKIWNWWQNVTNLQLEHAEYSKMIVQDVNNYIAVSTTGKVKKKGMFETEMAYHKNPSHLIIPKAVESYFINNVPIEDTIKKCTDIYDFCGGIKKKSNFKLNLYKTIDTAEIIEPQQKVTRYFVSNNKTESGLLVKDFDDGRKVSALANTMVQPLNKVVDAIATNYNINYDYYIRKTREIIENITPKVTQTTLF